MIEFDLLVSQSEVNAKYINLTDRYRRRYGQQIGEEGASVRVLDGKGRLYKMNRHGGNQLTGCSSWFQQNGVQPNTRILVRFDTDTRLLHLIPGQMSKQRRVQ